MSINRRALLGSTILTTLVPFAIPSITRAQDATPATSPPHSASPEAQPLDTPGYGIVRVRSLATPELTQAVFPDVMYRFLPLTAAVPGFYGYFFAFETDDPASSLSMTLLKTMEAAVAADEVARAYVADLDPRLIPETPLAEQGPIRIYERTERPLSELPPSLTGCHVTTRNKRNSTDTNIDAVVKLVTEDLVPILRAMDGFILYGWMMTPEGRLSFNIWETAEQLVAGDKAVADWVAAHPTITSAGETEVHAGIIGYANVLGQG